MKIQVSYLAFYLVVVATVVVLLEETTLTHAVMCNPIALSPCAPASRTAAPPSPVCCDRLRMQKPCLCGYYKNPILKRYVTGSDANKFAKACDITIKC
ncbi:hypothetical protein Nepgr_029056 [Nepenthes gracilis]|uniref:Bifunctional inhibitor/plant lipid transfer protein/seed storage helical domain-containing protein n=1 Tax=Nepenthes gracilis TaxID=150966 RepID=A0AAD3TBU1_NEPGR|nr:hypothetical protein Nepgr_029056 [Nepenthes gracilis]